MKNRREININYPAKIRIFCLKLYYSQFSFNQQQHIVKMNNALTN